LPPGGRRLVAGHLRSRDGYNREMRSGVRTNIGLDVRLTYYTGGGIARYIRHLASDLPSLDPSIQFTHFYRRGHAETFAPQARRVNCWTPAHHRLERLSLAAEIWPYNLDLLHSPDFIPPAAGYRRSVVTVHDLTFLRYPDFLTPDSRRYYNDQIRWAVGKATAISADSAATRDDLVGLLGVDGAKICVIHLGLEPRYVPAGPASTQTVDEPILQELGLSRGYVLFVGTFEPRKNVDGLLAAYALLRHHSPDAPRLVLVGRRGWLFEGSLEMMRQLGLESHVTILAEQPEANLPTLYRGAGLFVLLSHYEGFGFTVLEAMGCGVPAVIANRASLPEIAGEAALLVEPDNPEQAAQAMGRGLADSALRADLIARGLAQAARFSWDDTARATLALYRRVLAS
jgi:glycosyltransferase involved in cell wall biosynthesis